ncbi:putative RNA methyltransferase [Clostridia bacterium]|nr:putative RNA methyltransferase [Clostridia bacterium]
MGIPARNDEAVLTIDRLNSEAQGVARRDGFVWFVNGALPGESVRARVIKPGARSCVARVMELIEPSPERADPPCPYYARCGGCSALHMTYAAELNWKTNLVRDCLQRIGGIESPNVKPALGMDEPWHYRNKGAFPVTGEAGRPTIGCYAPRSHEVIDAPNGCLLQKPETNRIIEAVRAWMISHSIEPYNESMHSGLIRHIVTRVNRDSESMLTVVTRSADARLPHSDELVKRLREVVPGLRGLSVSPNPERGNVIFGDTCQTIWGEPSLTERLELSVGTLCYDLSPRSFFQVNTAQAERLVETVLSYATGNGTDHQSILKETVESARNRPGSADIYCGTGTLTLALAKAGFETVGVELLPDAVSDARRNASANGFPDERDVRFERGNAAVVLPTLVKTQGQFDVIVLDPPRKGCDKTVLESAALTHPSRLVYVSCDPATLARDAAVLAGLGYRLIEAQPIDQFCWTASIETVALFTPK